MGFSHLPIFPQLMLTVRAEGNGSGFFYPGLLEKMSSVRRVLSQWQSFGPKLRASVMQVSVEPLCMELRTTNVGGQQLLRRKGSKFGVGGDSNKAGRNGGMGQVSEVPCWSHSTAGLI